MSKRKKLEKFSEILQFDNVYENFDFRTDRLTLRPGVELSMKGKWCEKHFANENPIILELACGYGEYTVSLAEKYSERNFIGVDIKGNRIYRGAKYALDNELGNVAFLRTRIEHIDEFFEPGEVSGIWITFPDPFLKKGKSNRRLTSHTFLEKYRSILNPGGYVYLKTDSTELFEYSMEVLSSLSWVDIHYVSRDIYADTDRLYLPELMTKTRYENIHLDLGKTIKFVHFSFQS